MDRMQKGKRIYIEILRIWGCFFVLFNHSCKTIITIEVGDFSKSRVVALILFYFCKTAVPIFLMIAGANLLSKEDSFQKWKQRVFRILFILVGISLFYSIYYNKGLDLLDFLLKLYQGKISTALWYLYIYLGILIMLPVLRKVKLDRNSYIYIFILYCIGPGLLPFLQYYFGIVTPRFIFDVFPVGYIVAFFMGDFIDKKVQDKYLSRRGVVFSWIGLFVSLIFSLLCTLYQMNLNGYVNMDDMYNTIYYTPTLVLAVCVFFLVKYYLGTLTRRKIVTIVEHVGACTFGIYLIGDFLRDMMEVVFDILKEKMSQLMSVLIYVTCVFIVGFIIVYIYQRIVSQLQRKCFKSGI